jgi:5-methylcytosine-specific restriction protein A
VTDYGDLARPDLLPKPTCRVMLVCGPPAAGKSTYVKRHRGAFDIVIDLDSIAREHGYGRVRPPEATAVLLTDRNDRLAKLHGLPPKVVAWVIIGAPSQKLRAWWSNLLGVRDGGLIVLNPGRDELRRRIMNDPDRVEVRQLHIKLVDQWLARERENKAGRILRGCDVDGWPSDPLHSWNG